MKKIQKMALFAFGSLVLIIVIAIIAASGDSQPKTNIKKDVHASSTEVIVVSTAIKTPAPVKSNSDPATYSVLEVVDGDTFKVSINGVEETVRMIGMDTPETVDPRKPVQCFGVESSNEAKALLTGKKVRLEDDPTQGERDKYGRLLRYAYLPDGTFFNKFMILEGYAHEYTYDIPYRYQVEFKAAQAEAQAAKRGLWADNVCASFSSTPTASPASTCGNYCTSSYSTATYYYCANDPAWRGLTPKYLKSFETKEGLLVAYPNRKIHDASLCQ